MNLEVPEDSYFSILWSISMTMDIYRFTQRAITELLAVACTPMVAVHREWLGTSVLELNGATRDVVEMGLIKR